MTYWNLAKHFGALSVLWISYGDDNAPGFVRTASKSRVEREGNIFKVRFSAKRLHCVIEDGAIITQLWQGKRQWDFIAVCSCKEGINISTPLLRRVWLRRIRKNSIRIAKMSREWKPAKGIGNHTSGTNAWKSHDNFFIKGVIFDDHSSQMSYNIDAGDICQMTDVNFTV